MDDSPIVQLLDDLVLAAVGRGASDIHLEPQEKFWRVRFRINGKLVVVREFARELLPPLLSRLKIVSQLPLDEHRRPAEGKWLFRVNEQTTYDIRVSIIPFLYGEGAVLRILKLLGMQPDLRSLGFRDDAVCASIHRTISERSGLFLVVGSTGCGKSTTIYTLLQMLNDGSRKIITVEDPVEYAAKGISQVNVAANQGLSFASALRAILRQAPNVLFIGEIRDQETAAIAIQAALTGHFVFSTLHADGVAGAVSRIENLQISKCLIGATIRGILAQRLVRCLCPHCRRQYPLPPALAQRLALDESVRTFQPGKCEKCRQSGYDGRTVHYEWAPLAGKGTQPEKLQNHINDCRTMTFSASARQLLLEGRVSADDILVDYANKFY
ncbi:MAG: GspE/PulE family protein [Puniceicoccales bacterium]|nr:GspE/PulE family protein [Puniceicoccales bacterium]